jgi:hypothetical protein
MRNYVIYKVREILRYAKEDNDFIEIVVDEIKKSDELVEKYEKVIDLIVSDYNNVSILKCVEIIHKIHITHTGLFYSKSFKKSNSQLEMNKHLKRPIKRSKSVLERCLIM